MERGAPGSAAVELSSKAPTSQFVFLGTPHRAMSIRGWDRIFTSIQEVAREYSEAAKAGVLVEHPNSSELSQLLEAFEKEMTTTSSSLPILSLFEEHEAFSQGAPVLVSDLRIHAATASHLPRTRYSADQFQVTTSENACLFPSETVNYLPGNHVTISRFSSEKDIGYRLVLDFFSSNEQSIDLALSESSSDFSIPHSTLEVDVEKELMDFKGMRYEAFLLLYP